MAEEATAKTGIRSWADADFFTEFWYHDENKLRRALEYLKAEVKKNGGMLNLSAGGLPRNMLLTIQAAANANISGEISPNTMDAVSAMQFLGITEEDQPGKDAAKKGFKDFDTYEHGQFIDEATVDSMSENVDIMNRDWREPLTESAEVMEIGSIGETFLAWALAYGMWKSGTGGKPNPYDEIDDILAKEGTVAGEAAEEAAAIENGGKVAGAEGAGKVKLPNNDAQLKHIFRDAEGHLLDTPANRSLLESASNNPKNFIGRDAYGTQWYAQIQPDGSQIWVRTYNGTIINAGLNMTPRTFDPQTGFNKNPLK